MAYWVSTCAQFIDLKRILANTSYDVYSDGTDASPDLTFLSRYCRSGRSVVSIAPFGASSSRPEALILLKRFVR